MSNSLRNGIAVLKYVFLEGSRAKSVRESSIHTYIHLVIPILESHYVRIRTARRYISCITLASHSFNKRTNWNPSNRSCPLHLSFLPYLPDKVFLRVSDITLGEAVMASILLFRSVEPLRGILRSRRRRLLGFLLPLLLLARFGKERLLVVARREKLSF